MSKASDLRRKFYDNFSNVKKIINDADGQFLWGIDISLSNPALTIFNTKKNTFNSYSNKKKGSFYSRISQIEKSFGQYVRGFYPRLVLIEGYAYSSNNKREILGEVSYAVKRQLVRVTQSSFVPCLIVPPLTLKKFILERPAQGVKKNDIHKLIKNEWGAGTKNNDESDSYALCLMAKTLLKILRNVDIGKKYDDKFIMKLLKKSPVKGISDSRWSSICSVIMNDGENINRFFIEST